MCFQVYLCPARPTPASWACAEPLLVPIQELGSCTPYLYAPSCLQSLDLACPVSFTPQSLVRLSYPTPLLAV